MKLAPIGRPLKFNFHNPHKIAAVALIIYPDEEHETRLILIKRNHYEGVHSGQVSFPGGKQEIDDSSLAQTALRESNEEIGLKKNNVMDLGRMNYLLSRHKVEVNPFVGYLESNQEFIGNFEIDEIFDVPVSFLLNNNNILYKEFKRNDLRISMPSWVYNGNRIWGLTALITADFLNMCFDAKIDTNIDLIRGYDQY